MKFSHVAKIIPGDASDSMYYIDGEKQDDIYSDAQLLQRLLGKSFQQIWLVDDDNMDEAQQEALWSTSYYDDLDDLLDHLRANPDLVEEV